LYYGAWKVLTTRAAGQELTMSAEWFASLWAFAASGMSDGALIATAHVGFWVHSALVLIFLNILPFSKHFHIITAIPNVFTHDRTPRGALPKVDDLEGKVERDESVGINRLEDLTWNHILDLYTCTECGRCSDNCPAYTTDKTLSPKHLTLALRDHLYDTENAMFGDEEGVSDTLRAGPEQDGDTREPIHANPPAPEDGYFRSGKPVELVPNIVNPDVLWACTTCRACEEQCPVMISYVDKIVGMRRELVMVKAEMPPELQRPFQGMEMNGNPWNISAADRGDWVDELKRNDGIEVPFLSDHKDAAVLYWVGCAASYDNRAKKTAKAVAKLLTHAGVDFAVLGTEETCTGDPARRAGNEYLFQMLAEQNIETLNGYACDKKTIVTACPHCFNTLANEYPDFGGRYEVVHHSDFLQGLLAQRKLVPSKSVTAKIAFHDSCYLGRYNDVYESPREVLRAIPGVELLEVPYWNRSKGLCCGAGGAQMWMEEQNENRVNVKRTLQLLDTGADTVASGCPFCMTMLTDGLKNQDKDEEIDQLDIAELLVKAVDFGEAAEAAE
ncbi:MAG: heterodisulfide reductase-related iron-sulfur binding cluster, partial [Myxococcota bacterium]